MSESWNEPDEVLDSDADIEALLDELPDEVWQQTDADIADAWDQAQPVADSDDDEQDERS